MAKRQFSRTAVEFPIRNDQKPDRQRLCEHFHSRNARTHTPAHTKRQTRARYARPRSDACASSPAAPPKRQWRGNSLGARSRSRLVAVVRCGYRRGVGAAFAGGRNLPPPAPGSSTFRLARRSYCRPFPTPAATPLSLLSPLPLGRAPRSTGAPPPPNPRASLRSGLRVVEVVAAGASGSQWVGVGLRCPCARHPPTVRPVAPSAPPKAVSARGWALPPLRSGFAFSSLGVKPSPQRAFLSAGAYRC